MATANRIDRIGVPRFAGCRGAPFSRDKQRPTAEWLVFNLGTRMLGHIDVDSVGDQCPWPRHQRLRGSHCSSGRQLACPHLRRVDDPAEPLVLVGVVPLDEATGALDPGLVCGVEDSAVSGGALVDAVARGDALGHRDAEHAALVHPTGHYGSMPFNRT